MHPPIGTQQTELCKHLSDALNLCRKENGLWSKFTNRCDSIRSQFEKCLLEEYEIRRKENFIKSQERMKRYEQNNLYFEKMKEKKKLSNNSAMATASTTPDTTANLNDL